MNKALPRLKQKAADQRELREARKRLHPPMAIPLELDEERALEVPQKLNDEGSNTLDGFAVSPGKITGEASVILSPADLEKMQPGTILVCPMTTPAWTQLFPHATGLVTNIGSITAHGSIVAREYGIPAVLGLGNITQRIVSGQLIRVDGDNGVVTLLDE